MDFDKMTAEGGSFVATPGTMEPYREWARQQVCIHCGDKASDRERDENGKITGKWWLTETDCGCTWPSDVA